jgi:hypothetical protein
MTSQFLGPSWRQVGGYNRTNIGNYARFPYLANGITSGGNATISAGNNISVNNTNPQSSVVSISSPLTSTLNLGSQNVIGTTGNITFTNNSFNNSASSILGNGFVVNDIITPAISTIITKTIIASQTATDNLSFNTTGIFRNDSTTGAGIVFRPVNASVSGTPVVYTSDFQFATASSMRRLKTNITPLVTDTSIIYDVEPKKYDAIDGSDSNITGFIAEELDEISPEFVIKMHDNMSPNWNTMIVYMIEEIKKLRARVTELESHLPNS